MNLTEKEINELNRLEKLTEDYFYFNLGVGLQYEYSPKNIHYSAPYLEMGKEIWNSLNSELYELLCDDNIHQPKEWVKDLISGDIRNLAVGIVAAITSKYNVSLAIAFPAAALIIKKGVLFYCSKRPDNLKKSVSEILENEKKFFSIKNEDNSKKNNEKTKKIKKPKK